MKWFLAVTSLLTIMAGSAAASTSSTEEQLLHNLRSAGGGNRRVGAANASRFKVNSAVDRSLFEGTCSDACQGTLVGKYPFGCKTSCDGARGRCEVCLTGDDLLEAIPCYKTSNVGDSSITVDGLYGDWGDLSLMASATMYNSGDRDTTNSNSFVFGKAYATYDCKINKLCVLVLNDINPATGALYEADTGESWVKVYASNEGASDLDGNLEYVMDGDKRVGWEGCFVLPAKPADDPDDPNPTCYGCTSKGCGAQIHVNIQGQTSSTGKNGFTIALEIPVCPVYECTDTDTSDCPFNDDPCYDTSCAEGVCSEELVDNCCTLDDTDSYTCDPLVGDDCNENVCVTEVGADAGTCVTQPISAAPVGCDTPDGCTSAGDCTTPPPQCKAPICTTTGCGLENADGGTCDLEEVYEDIEGDCRGANICQGGECKRQYLDGEACSVDVTVPQDGWPGCYDLHNGKCKKYADGTGATCEANQQQTDLGLPTTCNEHYADIGDDCRGPDKCEANLDGVLECVGDKFQADTSCTKDAVADQVKQSFVIPEGGDAPCYQDTGTCEIDQDGAGATCVAARVAEPENTECSGDGFYGDAENDGDCRSPDVCAADGGVFKCTPQYITVSSTTCTKVGADTQDAVSFAPPTGDIDDVCYSDTNGKCAPKTDASSGAICQADPKPDAVCDGPGFYDDVANDCRSPDKCKENSDGGYKCKAQYVTDSSTACTKVGADTQAPAVVFAVPTGGQDQCYSDAGTCVPKTDDSSGAICEAHPKSGTTICEYASVDDMTTDPFICGGAESTEPCLNTFVTESNAGDSVCRKDDICKPVGAATGSPLTCQKTFKSYDTECRETEGCCDPEEYCTGTAATCPIDKIEAAESDFVCRTSCANADGTEPATLCLGNPEETCQGDVSCPRDVFLSDELCIVAGQNYEAGKVSVTGTEILDADGEVTGHEICVKAHLAEWTLEEMHVFIGTGELPKTQGQYTLKFTDGQIPEIADGVYDLGCYDVTLPDADQCGGDTVKIAIHFVVDSAVNGGQTAWAMNCANLDPSNGPSAFKDVSITVGKQNRPHQWFKYATWTPCCTKDCDSCSVGDPGPEPTPPSTDPPTAAPNDPPVPSPPSGPVCESVTTTTCECDGAPADASECAQRRRLGSNLFW